MNVLKLGTRKSLLAWAQSGWVAREIERLHPEVKVELVGIETRGDRILDVPLQSVTGKEFFVAELDEALKSGAVDLTVHSMKDLSLDRPREFALGAIPKRENPRDVVLFGPHALNRLRAGERLRVGTSSPRRVENIPDFLARALPRLNERVAEVEFIEIRGNVNTRLSRVHESVESPKCLDAVVLAFAGIIRLWNDADARVEMTQLLKDVRWMVLPLRECPAAPAQGALAVECRKSDSRVRALLEKLHHQPTADQVGEERGLLSLWGGGCHQKFGASCIELRDLGRLNFIRGKKPDGEFVEELRWKLPGEQSPGIVTGTWNGHEWRSGSQESDRVLSSPIHAIDGPAFIAHSRAVNREWARALSGRIWTSGVASWFRLAEQGLWVEGCAEGFGFDLLRATIEEPVLRLGGDWTVLTHDQGTSEWSETRGITAIATYRTAGGAKNAVSNVSLRSTSHFFWSSGSQFDELKQGVSLGASHACGPGKTAVRLRAAGIEPLIFPTVREWSLWLKSY